MAKKELPKKGEVWLHQGSGTSYTVEFTFGFQLLSKWFIFVIYSIKGAYFIRTLNNFTKKFKKV